MYTEQSNDGRSSKKPYIKTIVAAGVLAVGYMFFIEINYNEIGASDFERYVKRKFMCLLALAFTLFIPFPLFRLLADRQIERVEVINRKWAQIIIAPDSNRLIVL